MSGRRGPRGGKTVVVPFPDRPDRLLTRTGPLAGPWVETVWTRRGERYVADGHGPATIAQLAKRYDEVRLVDS